MTISVFRTATPTWPGQGRQIVLVVAGDLRAREWSTLARAIAEAEGTGGDRIVLDRQAVRTCDWQALAELVAVRGRRPTAQRCLVDVVGVRAAQFAALVDRAGGRRLTLLPGHRRRVGQVTLEVLAPDPRRATGGAAPNDLSMVVRADGA